MPCWLSQLLKIIPEKDLLRLLSLLAESNGNFVLLFLNLSHVTCFGAQITPLA
jgi:hypothetical protein